ncbi:transposase [Nonomuraea polychroma]|uniref:Transposase n=1 Tax=Nonomuraea polychroma TaxID=46176 RepID=A0A438MPP2_9ACTN|nr:RNA-guided endonuclease TnpB family protein [Nonomuraea polychroma]RVX47790.1 transposase [Nonomuraea polychroma]
MRRSFKFLLRPTSKQAAALAACLEDHRQLYNGALEHRRTAYRKAGVTVGYGDQSGELKDIRADDPDGQGRWSFSSQQATLRRLDKAFKAFFARVKAGRTPGFPRFKGRGWFDTVEWPKDGDGCRWDSQPEHPTATFVRLQGIGHVRVHQHRPVLGRVKTISIKREGSRWYVVLACDEVPAEPLPPTGAVVGIDMGTTYFLTTSGGEHVANPRFMHAMADELAEAQRHLATFPKRTRQRAKRHRAAVRKVAKLYAKIRRQRLDFHHKTARALIRDHDVIAHERLNTAGMTRTPKPKPDPEVPGAFLPNGAAAKAGLNRSILDAGWVRFLGILANKAESAGRLLVPVDARNTSRTCLACGHVAKENRVTQAKFECVKCGFAANADHVGATNVLNRAGLVLCDVA